jgi:cytochrome c556
MSWAVACALASAATVAACGFYADEPAKKVTKEQIKEMMTKVHKGEKAALTRVGAELKKEGLDWEQLAKDAKEFTDLGELLKTGASPYTSPKRYIDSAAELTKAAKDKDRKAATTAFGNLSRSCNACHYGNPAK